MVELSKEELTKRANQRMNSGKMPKKVVARRRGDNKREARRDPNTTVVDNKTSHLGANHDELKHTAQRMQEQFGDTQLPAVLYKGQTIPRRTLSNYSYLSAD